MIHNEEKNILVVEDEALLLQVISKKLEIKGYIVVTATTGEQALDYLSNLSTTPDAIWLDYYLGAGINGLDVMTELKKHKKWSKIPVVIVSNSATDEKIHTMLALGAREYLLKAEYRLDDIVKIFDEFIIEDKKEKK